MKLTIGDRVKIVSGEHYLGMTGVIEFCNKCCRHLRIQFDGIGNNEKLLTYRKHIQRIP